MFKIWMQERLSHVAWDQINPWWLWMWFLMGFSWDFHGVFDVWWDFWWDSMCQMCLVGIFMGVWWEFTSQQFGILPCFGKLDGSEIGGIHPVYGCLWQFDEKNDDDRLEHHQTYRNRMTYSTATGDMTLFQSGTVTNRCRKKLLPRRVPTWLFDISRVFKYGSKLPK